MTSRQSWAPSSTATLCPWMDSTESFTGRRVLENGLRIAEANGAIGRSSRLFALFHDSRRVNEDQDDGHGLRGGEFARSLRGKLVHLDDDRFDLLFEACRLHTEGLTVRRPDAVGRVGDADRLDLGRVGITPSPKAGSAPRPAAVSWPGRTSGLSVVV